MDTLVSMKVFAAVVESHSFSGAAERLEMSRAMVSKHIAHLEEHLGVRLLQRTTRKLGLTESGALYHERCSQILNEIMEAEVEAANLTATPRGTLRITMPVSFAVRHIAPLLSQFMMKNPEVQIEASLSDRKADLIDEGFDLALRIGPTLEPGLIARKIANDRLVICGSPKYLRVAGTPRRPEELATHDCFLYTHAAVGNEWKLRGPDTVHTIKVAGRLKANNGDLLNQIVCEGIGLMCQPQFIVGEDIRTGRLVEVLPDYWMDPIGIYAVYPSRKHLSTKIRAFVDFVAAHFESKGAW